MNGLPYKYNKNVSAAKRDEFGVPILGRVGPSGTVQKSRAPRAPNKPSPGTITDSKFYKAGTPGIFVKSTKGMPGKHFVEKALDRVIEYYNADMKG